MLIEEPVENTKTEQLKSKYPKLEAAKMYHINTSQEETDNDEELVDAFESDFWKSATVGNLLAGYRLKHQLTQKQLAARADMSHATISAYETGKKQLSRRSAIKLADALGEDSDCFLKNLPDGK